MLLYQAQKDMKQKNMNKKELDVLLVEVTSNSFLHGYYYPILQIFMNKNDIIQSQKTETKKEGKK